MLATARNTCKISVRARDQELANDNRICISGKWGCMTSVT